MGTQASPNLVMTIIDLTTGNPDTGETVEIVPYGDTYPTNKVILSEIGTTGRYKKETADASPAVAEGAWKVYVGAAFRGIFLHGGDFIEAHLANSSDPHGVSGAQVAITDSGGYFAGSDVETALQEIGASLAGKASAASTVLTNISNQTVASGKPKVTNLNADMLDGLHLGSATDTIPQLGQSSSTKLSTDLLGKRVGSQNDYIPQISTDVTPEAGKVHTTILAKKVGTGDDNIPQITNDATPDAGKIHSSLLGIKKGEMGGRTATENIGDVPAPDEEGGATIWAETTLIGNPDINKLDDSIDWRDRLITVEGFIIQDAAPADYLAGGAKDYGIRGYTSDVAGDMLGGEYFSAMFFSGAGYDTSIAPAGTDHFVRVHNELIYFMVSSADGALYAQGFEGTNKYALSLKITCSPDQGHV